MRKHRRKPPRDIKRLANANSRLPESVKTSVIGVTNSIVGGENAAATYLIEEYRSKFCDESITPGSERRANAVSKFLGSEERNRTTNEWWRSRDEDFNILPRVPLRRFLRFARRLIREILGPLSDELVLGSFSGGASTSRPRTTSHPAWKFDGKADATEEAVKFVDLIHRQAPLLRHYAAFNDINVVAGNVLFTVPKKTDIDRCACKEPDLNMFLQKGVGKHIRRRLLRHGINLNDQSVNRNLARLGSRDNTLATLDLSSASDLISIEVVKCLLPDEWFLYLNDIRSHFTQIDEETIQLEMFSSMGNGFTFELESLLFYALTRTVLYFEGISGVVSVYGDDIICPSAGYSMVTFVLERFGFLVNEDKSFHTGPFRESCGGHYHNGEDITPFYIKKSPERLTDLIRVANQLRRWCLVCPFRQYELPYLYLLWRSLADHVPSEYWGGYDLALDTRLVSPPRGNMQLVRLRNPMKVSEVGNYLLWHNSNWNRTQTPDEGAVELASTNQICRRKRAKLGAPVVELLFHQEL